MRRMLRSPISMAFILLMYKVALYQLYRGTAVQQHELITGHAFDKPQKFCYTLINIIRDAWSESSTHDAMQDPIDSFVSGTGIIP